jgi:hypothetical protein
MTKRNPAEMTAAELDYEARYINEVVNFNFDNDIPFPEYATKEAHLTRHAELCAELASRG